MNISELSTTESRQLLLIHTKLNYDNADSVNKVIKLIKVRGFFQSEAGQVFRTAIEDYVSGKSPIDCIYCRQPLDYGEYLICRECNQSLFDRVNQENKEIQKERAEVSAAQAAAVKIAQNLHNPEYAEQEEMLEYARERLEIIAADSMEQEHPAVDLFSQGEMRRTGYQGVEEYSYNEDRDVDALSDQNVRAAGVGHKKSKVQRRKHNGQNLIVILLSIVLVLLMAVLVALRVTDVSTAGGLWKKSGQAAAEYDDATAGAGAENSQQVAWQPGDESTDADAYSKPYDMAANGPDTSELTDSSSKSNMLTDGYELLGQPYMEVDNEYGKYEEYLDYNARYYPECGVSLVFEEDTKRIIYIENDGTGSGINVVPILGIVPGESTVRMIKTLADNGLEIAEITEDNFICQFGSKENPAITYELSVTSNEGTINLISVRVIK